MMRAIEYYEVSVRNLDLYALACSLVGLGHGVRTLLNRAGSAMSVKTDSNTYTGGNLDLLGPLDVIYEIEMELISAGQATDDCGNISKVGLSNAECAVIEMQALVERRFLTIEERKSTTVSLKVYSGVEAVSVSADVKSLACGNNQRFIACGKIDIFVERNSVRVLISTHCVVQARAAVSEEVESGLFYVLISNLTVNRMRLAVKEVYSTPVVGGIVVSINDSEKWSVILDSNAELVNADADERALRNLKWSIKSDLLAKVIGISANLVFTLDCVLEVVQAT